MELKIYTDGGSINNPGPAASAFTVQDGNKILHQESFSIGINTNNFAEYSALVKALEWLIINKPEGSTAAVFYSDSNLMVNQLNGLFKVRNPSLREFILKIRSLEQEVGLPVAYKYIPREKNRLADSLVKKSLFKQN